jgi:hypothetical protein
MNMLIYAFAEVFPSPYKPYHDTQFEQFIADGHELVVCAFESHAGELSEDGKNVLARASMVRLPSVLRDVARLGFNLAGKLTTHPLNSMRRAKAIFAADDKLNRAVVRTARAWLLPVKSPELCIVHNLIAQSRLSFLRDVYPRAAIVFYYHGGESVGVPEVTPDTAREAFSAADVVFTNTESSRRHAIIRGCSPEKIFISPVGFNLTRFPDPVFRGYRKGDVLNVLSVGRLSVEKGHGFALQAIRQLVNDGVKVRYRIVGGGAEEACLREYVSTHGLQAWVQFVGILSAQELLVEYSTADVLLLPSVDRGNWQENQS